jgi:fatty-acyl-CoA synthase
VNRQVLITDREFSPTIAKALDILKTQHGQEILVIDVCDSEFKGAGERVGHLEYEEWLACAYAFVAFRGSAR